MKYIDAEKLIAEIERRKNNQHITFHARNELIDLLSFIDTLEAETKEVELEKEIKETIEIAEEHAMLAGRIQMEEEMKKKAIEGTLDGNHLILHYSDLAEVLPEGKSGDRVKAIIVKIDVDNQTIRP